LFGSARRKPNGAKYEIAETVERDDRRAEQKEEEAERAHDPQRRALAR
jgi:hypothetical protein